MHRELSHHGSAHLLCPHNIPANQCYHDPPYLLKYLFSSYHVLRSRPPDRSGFHYWIWLSLHNSPMYRNQADETDIWSICHCRTEQKGHGCHLPARIRKWNRHWPEPFWRNWFPLSLLPWSRSVYILYPDKDRNTGSVQEVPYPCILPYIYVPSRKNRILCPYWFYGGHNHSSLFPSLPIDRKHTFRYKYFLTYRWVIYHLPDRHKLYSIHR